jgi:hypothetical protein
MDMQLPYIVLIIIGYVRTCTKYSTIIITQLLYYFRITFKRGALSQDANCIWKLML